MFVITFAGANSMTDCVNQKYCKKRFEFTTMSSLYRIFYIFKNKCHKQILSYSLFFLVKSVDLTDGTNIRDFDHKKI